MNMTEIEQLKASIEEVRQGAAIAEGPRVGLRAPDFTLTDQTGAATSLKDCVRQAPTLLAFYPGDFTLVCTKQLCSYRDSFAEFRGLGVQIVGISANSTHSQASFSKEYGFSFRLLSDPGHRVAKLYECVSRLMFGRTTRGVFIVNRFGIVVYRAVEATPITHRNGPQLLADVATLRRHNIL